MENGNEVRITDQLIMNQKSAVEVKEVIKTALRQMVAGESPMRQKLDYSRLDSAYTKYVRNKAKRGQIGSTTETFNEIFPQTTITSSTSNSVGTSAIFQYPVNEMQEAWNEYQKAKTMISDTRQRKLEKPSNVMPETKKRAITLEDA